jgi:hypothetical protein
MKKYIKYSYSKDFSFLYVRLIITAIFLFISTVMSVANDAIPVKTTSQKPTKTQQQEQTTLKHSMIDTKIVHNFDSLGSFKDWEAFAMITPNETVCWLSSANLEAKKENKTKTPSTLMLSIRLENKDRDEFSYHSHYNLAPEEKLNMTLDRVVGFKLVSQGHWAWLQSSIDESRFVLAAQKGTNLVLSGKTTHDKKIYETYSLSGFTAAYKAAFEACNKAIQEKSPSLEEAKTEEKVTKKLENKIKQ